MSKRTPKGSWKKNQSICGKRGNHDYKEVKKEKDGSVLKKGDKVCLDCGFIVKNANEKRGEKLKC